MTIDQKVDICRMRMEGESIYAIAKKLGVTSQNIHSMIKRFPYDERVKTHPERPNMETERMLEICRYYFQSKSVNETALHFGIKTREIKAIFSFIVAKRSHRLSSEYYPILTEWMALNACSAKTLAHEIGVPVVKLGNIIAGRQNAVMTYEIAESISAYTGLSFSEIFAVQLANEEARNASFPKPPKKTKREEMAYACQIHS